MTISTIRARRALAVAAVATLGLGGSGALLAAKAHTTTVRATLKPGSEVPPPTNPGGAHGSFRGTLKGTKLSWTLRFSNLTSAPAGAHIHTGARGTTGPVVVVLCGTTCRSPMSGTATVPASLIAAMKSGNAYVNVHTAKNPTGEIRGQIKVRTK